MSEAFIGAGISFPLRLDPSGALALSTGPQEIEEAIRLILGTSPGERPMRPEFGCRIHEYLFASADSETANAITREVRGALQRWEPRINVTDVVVSFDTLDHTLLYIDVRYSIKATNDRRNLVFPFYVIPGGD